ncbi:septation protein SepH, partial [Allorhizocola rhizosphaerae]|uniref:septation protein SepH n=1 Tax=Allorhizocola rhizosphaerae TaxID=1872709 RepID=UPI0013C36CFC
MRPVRFVALSEDGQALVLADEVGRLLSLPIDERVSGALDPNRAPGSGTVTIAAVAFDANNNLSPRDIQARIRSGESADDVARIAGVPVDRVLRYAGPVLQERAMLAQHARRTRLKTSEKGTTLADVVDGRLAQHGIDTEKISWDAYRREDGTWRVVATWPSGKATAQAVWELDRNRQSVTPHDDMAQYLCAERPTQILGQDPTAGQGPVVSRSGRDLGGHGLPTPSDASRRPSRDPIRAGRDALIAAMDRPLGSGPGRG